MRIGSGPLVALNCYAMNGTALENSDEENYFRVLKYSNVRLSSKLHLVNKGNSLVRLILRSFQLFGQCSACFSHQISVHICNMQMSHGTLGWKNKHMGTGKVQMHANRMVLGMKAHRFEDWLRRLKLYVHDTGWDEGMVELFKVTQRLYDGHVISDYLDFISSRGWCHRLNLYKYGDRLNIRTLSLQNRGDGWIEYPAGMNRTS